MKVERNADIFQQVVDLSRRDVLSRGLTVAGWGAFVVALGAGAAETVSFFFPRVVFRPPSTFRLGSPAEFVGAGDGADRFGVILVDGRWKTAQRFFVVRDREGIYALSARCAHLGCTINWFDDAGVFRCPCHGSEYYANGVPFAGPAPRPLDRLHIELTVDGDLIVDTSVVYGPDRFHVPGAFLAL